jgi:hypothetical protein
VPLVELVVVHRDELRTTGSSSTPSKAPGLTVGVGN